MKSAKYGLDFSERELKSVIIVSHWHVHETMEQEPRKLER